VISLALRSEGILNNSRGSLDITAIAPVVLGGHELRIIRTGAACADSRRVDVVEE
jgi:hypothetical protein